MAQGKKSLLKLKEKAHPHPHDTLVWEERGPISQPLSLTLGRDEDLLPCGQQRRKSVTLNSWYYQDLIAIHLGK